MPSANSDETRSAPKTAMRSGIRSTLPDARERAREKGAGQFIRIKILRKVIPESSGLVPHPSFPLLRDPPPLVHLALEVARALLDLGPPVALGMVAAAGSAAGGSGRTRRGTGAPPGRSGRRRNLFLLRIFRHSFSTSPSITGIAKLRVAFSGISHRLPARQLEEQRPRGRACRRPSARRACPSRACARGGRSRCGRTIFSTSESRWLETKTARPCSPASRRTSSRISRMPAGSRPFVGSSRMSTAGSERRACAMPTRWRMPSE